MTEDHLPKLAAFRIAMLADPTRLRVAMLLDEEPRDVTALVAALGSIGQTALSFHLAKLRYAGIVQSRVNGKSRVYSLTEKGSSLFGAISPLLESAP